MKRYSSPSISISVTRSSVVLLVELAAAVARIDEGAEADAR